MNDYMRDILDESYTVKDQTRQGSSESGLDAGEVDIQICADGFPVVMIECVKLASLDKTYLDKHINKILTKYDPNGCPYVFVIIYSTVKNFDGFYNNLTAYLNNYSFPYVKETDVSEVDTGYSELKHSNCILIRNGKRIRVHFYAVHIQ